MKTTYKTVRTSIATLTLIGSVIGGANAAVISGVTINDVSTELNASPFNRSAVNILNGSGFSSTTGFHINAPDLNTGTMWLTNGTLGSHPPQDPLPAHIVFDLGQSYDLSSFKVWNYNEESGGNSSRGANTVTISIASSHSSPFTSLGNFTFNKATGSEAVDFGQVIDLSSFAVADDTRLIRFDILSNHGGDSDLVGLSEIRFDGESVPEPTSSLLLGLGSIGLLFRRSRR